MKFDKRLIIFISMIIMSSLVLWYMIFFNGVKYDINSLNNNELIIKLDSLAGIGQKKAEIICSNRPYKDLSEIKKLDGIGEITYKKIDKYFKVVEVK